MRLFLKIAAIVALSAGLVTMLISVVQLWYRVLINVGVEQSIINLGLGAVIVMAGIITVSELDL